ncbi:MAG TPA: hypothetical protein VI588_04235, partial [Candidatus Gracilibacteria bacterium]|nr:hypothetical protein [Candidatus Gracilibacteria bacterium]
MTDPKRFEDGDTQDGDESLHQPRTIPPTSESGLAAMAGIYISRLKGLETFRRLESEPDGMIVRSVNPAKAIADRFEEMLFFSQEDLFDTDKILSKLQAAYSYAYKTIFDPRNAVYLKLLKDDGVYDPEIVMLEAVQRTLTDIAKHHGLDEKLLNYIVDYGSGLTPAGADQNEYEPPKKPEPIAVPPARRVTDRVGLFGAQPDPQQTSRVKTMPMRMSSNPVARSVMEAEIRAVPESTVASVAANIEELPAELKKPSLAPAPATTTLTGSADGWKLPPVNTDAESAPSLRDKLEAQAQFDFETVFIPLFEKTFQIKLHEYNDIVWEAVMVIAKHARVEMLSSANLHRDYFLYETKRIDAGGSQAHLVYRMAQKALETRCDQVLGKDAEGNLKGSFLDTSIRGAITSILAGKDGLPDAKFTHLAQLDEESARGEYEGLVRVISHTFRRLLPDHRGGKLCWLASYFLEDHAERESILQDRIFELVVEHFAKLRAELPPAAPQEPEQTAEFATDTSTSGSGSTAPSTPDQHQDYVRAATVAQLHGIFDTEDEVTQVDLPGSAPAVAPIEPEPKKEPSRRRGSYVRVPAAADRPVPSPVPKEMPSVRAPETSTPEPKPAPVPTLPPASRKPVPKWKKIMFALTAAAGIGTGVQYLASQSDTDEHADLSQNNAPTTTPSVNNVAPAPTTTVDTPVTPPVQDAKKGPAPDVVPQTAEVLSSASYSLGASSGANVYTGPADMLVGGADATPYSFKTRTASWYEEKQKAADLLLKIYDNNKERFSPETAELIKKHEVSLRSLASQTNFTPATFRSSFESKFAAAEVFAADGVYNLVECAERILDLRGDNHNSVENDSAFIKLSIGSQLNKADERFARAIDFENAAGGGKGAPAVPGHTPAPQQLDQQNNTPGGGSKTGLITPELDEIDAGWNLDIGSDHESQTGSIFAAASSPAIEFEEVDIDLSELEADDDDGIVELADSDLVDDNDDGVVELA